MGDYSAGKAWKMAKEQRILEGAFQIFSERGIESVTMPDVAEVSGVSRATLYRYFTTKLDLVVAVGTWKWTEYIKYRMNTFPDVSRNEMTGADQLFRYLDSFLDLYRNHSDILRFNYSFNSYLSYEKGSPEQKSAYMGMVSALRDEFQVVYTKGVNDGTIRKEMPVDAMFSSSFHIMLAAVTRYAVGLMYQAADPEAELVMLEELLFTKYCTVPVPKRKAMGKKRPKSLDQ